MEIESRQLLLLLTWMSPAFPTGAFAYSHGLEWAIEDGIVQSAEELKVWIEDVITRGSGWNDAVLFSRCWDEDGGALNELALALAASRERHLETTQLGRAFTIAARGFFPSPLAGEEPAPDLIRGGRRPDEGNSRRGPSPAASRHPLPQGERGHLAYPVAAGTSCAAMGIERTHALLAFLHSFSSVLVSVAVRLIPLGQTQGLAVIRDLMPVIAATAERAAAATLGDLGAITLNVDIASMKHETQHSRIFRT